MNRVFADKYRGYCCGKKELLSLPDASGEIARLLEQDAPCMIARFGASEMRVVSEYHQVQFGLRKAISQDAAAQLCSWSGFFPDDPVALNRFAEDMVEATRSLDLLGVWNVSMEEYAVLHYAPHAAVTGLANLEPWYLPEQPWSRVLAGKKVLVIHPFAQTIRQQYEKRTELFPGTDILPEFELHAMQAVQTIAGQKDPRFGSWFDALDYMEQEALKIDFDVAILGCGAYGFPLAARLKQAGKKAIHLGGSTQLFFGIRGKRWDDIPFFTGLYNDAWVRPLDSETPEKAKTVEGGCYW